MIDDSHHIQASPQRQQLIRDGRLHWFHWAVLALSLTLTIAVWSFSHRQYEDRIQERFERETERAVSLVTERMQKYEDALWAGIGAIHVNGGQMDHQRWRVFSESLALEHKYPGINGIGVVYSVPIADIGHFVSQQQRDRPDFGVFPKHNITDHLPITFIEPLALNRSALGLDLAHEKNRYLGALRARDTGEAQITGPIVLVQDEAHTPGFLFYVPFYRDEVRVDANSRKEKFVGLVYAPFVVRKLMAGTLAAEQRYINIRIKDGDAVIYDELSDAIAHSSRQATLGKEAYLSLYGRSWQFEFHTNAKFWEAYGDNQSYMILLGGLMLDALLLALFLSLTRANRRALNYADEATEQLRFEKSRLQRSNEELEQFAYIASHDLQEPLRMVGNFVQLLQQRYRAQFDETADSYIGFAVEGVTRMQSMLHELLAYSRVGIEVAEPVSVDLNELLTEVMGNLRKAVMDTNAEVDVSQLPVVWGEKSQLLQLFQNLLSNAIKFSTECEQPKVEVRCSAIQDFYQFEIEDNGIGIEPEYFERIFTIFQRLHHRDEFEGNGIGLSICKKIVLRHGGRIWIESQPGRGSTFKFTMPMTPEERVSG